MSGVPQRKPEGEAAKGAQARSVRTSVVAGLVLAAIVVTTFILGPSAFFVLAFFVLLVAQAEFYAVLKASGYHPAALLGLLSGAVLLVATYTRGPLALSLAVAVPLPLLLAWGLTIHPERVRSMVVSTYIGIVYGPFLAAFLVLLLRETDGLVLTASVVGMVAVADSGAYLLGRKLGRRQLAPRTSPGKTWEGLLSGVGVVVVLSVVFLPLIHPFDWWLALRLALVVSLVAPVGDLAESLVKRDLGVKDMGSIMPGHGGFFDRIDAIVFVAPVAYFVLRVLEWAPVQ